MAENPKAQTTIHWAQWSDKEEQEWIAIGKTRYDADGRGLTKFTCTPTSAWGWRCVSLPEGERPPQLPLPQVTPQPQPTPPPPAPPDDTGHDAGAGEAEDAEPDGGDADEILPGAG